MLDVSNITATIGDFQRDYLYKLQFITYPDALNAKIANLRSIVDNLDLICTSSPIPEVKIKGIKILYAGMWGWWAGPNESSGTVQWMFRIPRDYGGLDFFEAWRDLNGDGENGLALPKPLTLGTVKQSLVDVDKTTVLKAYVLKNLSIYAIDAIEFKKEGTDIQTFKVTANYEKRLKVDSDLGSV